MNREIKIKIEPTSNNNKLDELTSLFPDDPEKAISAREVNSASLDWQHGHLKNKINEAVRHNLLAIHPDDLGKKGITYRYYRKITSAP